MFDLQTLINEFSEGNTLGGMLELDPQLNEALYSIGYALYQQAKYSEALKYFSCGVYLDHYDNKSLKAKAKCLKKMGEFEKALKIFSIANLFESNDVESLMDIVECLLKTGKSQDAQQFIELMIKEYGEISGCNEMIDRCRNIKELLNH